MTYNLTNQNAKCGYIRRSNQQYISKYFFPNFYMIHNKAIVIFLFDDSGLHQISLIYKKVCDQNASSENNTLIGLHKE